jgi:hypothetical protein
MPKAVAAQPVTKVGWMCSLGDCDACEWIHRADGTGGCDCPGEAHAVARAAHPLDTAKRKADIFDLPLEYL